MGGYGDGVGILIRKSAVVRTNLRKCYILYYLR